MARKKYAGSYLEKLYYDNTVFRGITATTDANSEGYFKQLINLDIADTGQSVQPRKGIINTSIYTNAGEFISLNANNTVYFKDNATGYYFFFDLGDLENIYKVIDIDSQLYEKQIYAELISGTITTKDNVSDTTVYLEDYLGYQLENIQISLVGSGHAQYTKDENLIDRYVVRVQDSSNKFWLALTYNATENKMLFTVINTDNIVGLIDSDRNIASSAKLVPDVLTRIYETTEQAALDGITYNQFPFMYIYDKKDNVYYIDRIKKEKIQDLIIKPRYYLLPLDENKRYVYTYEFYNTSTYANNTKKEFGIYDLNTNRRLDMALYKDLYLPLLNSNINENSIKPSNLYEFYGTLKDDWNKWGSVISNTLILIAVPKNPKELYWKHSNDTIASSNTLNVDSAVLFPDFYSALVTSAVVYNSNTTGINYPYIIDIFDNKPVSYIKNNMNKTGSILSMFDYYVIPADSLTKDYNTGGSTIENSVQTILNTGIYTTNQRSITSSEAAEYLDSYSSVVIKFMTTATNIKITNNASGYLYSNNQNQYIKKIFNNYYINKDDNKQDKDITQEYFVYTTLRTVGSYIEDNNVTVQNIIDSLFDIYNGAYIPQIYKKNIVEYTNLTDVLAAPFMLYSLKEPYTSLNNEYTNMLTINTSGDLELDFSTLIDNQEYIDMVKEGYFDNGIIFALYIKEVPVLTPTYTASMLSSYTRASIVASTNLVQSLNVSYFEDTPTITLVDNINPSNIKSSDNWCIFNSNEGYRLVVWYNNIVYMSEANNYYYFKQVNKKEYPEKVIKAVPFKDKLIIFTTQNVYAIFPYEYTESVENGKNDDGTTKYVQKTTIVYNSLPVLYNLNTSEYYSKVIQVYNNMILFYSIEGQLYLITPSATVDSDTAYTLKFINQAANDILKNYTEYINKRLNIYGLDTVNKADIEINASVTITHIKIFYSVPKLNYTYVLLYDITNNRYTVYDTNIFGTLYDILHIGEESLYISKYLYNEKFSIIKHYSEPITELFETDGNNCDWFTNDTYIFDKVPIHTEIDTGIIYLNNQWKKRFRTLRTIYKNLDSYSITYDLDVIIDDVYINTNMSNSVELRNVNDTYKVETVSNAVNLLTDNTALFDFSCFNSNKIVTHTTNIPSVGKHIELIMRFKSKGKYKIQGFAIVYKEHSA